MNRRTVRFGAGPLLALAGLLAAGACSDSATAPHAESRGSGGGKTATVKAVSPNAAPRNSTLDVTVSGSGFETGAQAEFALDGVVSPAIRINSTRYLSSSKLVANITIAPDAELELYDVIVTMAGGKKGIGTEMFAVTVEMILLGTPGGNSMAWAVNDGGVVVGVSNDRAFRWENGVMTPLGELPGDTYSWARDVNNIGQAVGFSCSTGGSCRAVIWPSTGGVTALPHLAGGLSQAHGINDAGQVVGSSVNAAGVRHAVIWNAGVITDIHSLAGGTSEAWKINRHGQVVGTWWSSSGFSEPAASQGSFTWTPATGMVLLGGGQGDGGEAAGINELGDIVGWAKPVPGQQQLKAYLWRNGNRTFLGLPGDIISVACGITDQGLVVGRVTVEGGTHSSGTFAFSWTEAGGATLIDGPSGSLVGWATDVNASRWMSGLVQNNSGDRAVLWKLP